MRNLSHRSAGGELMGSPFTRILCKSTQTMTQDDADYCNVSNDFIRLALRKLCYNAWCLSYTTGSITLTLSSPAPRFLILSFHLPAFVVSLQFLYLHEGTLDSKSQACAASLKAKPSGHRKKSERSLEHSKKLWQSSGSGYRPSALPAQLYVGVVVSPTSPNSVKEADSDNWQLAYGTKRKWHCNYRR